MSSASHRQHTSSSSYLRGPLPSQHISRPRSLVSISSHGSDAATRRRSALLELDQAFRKSLQRAQDALRASERSRNDMERRARTRSTLFAEPPPEARRRSPPTEQYHDNDQYVEIVQSGENRQGHRLHKSRSIPLNLLTSPSPKLQRPLTTSNDIRLKTISPPRLSHQPRRVASYGDLLSSASPTLRQPVSILQTSPTYVAPGPAPVLSRLLVPDEPTSKFSGSSGESKIDPNSATWDYSFRARARTLSHAASLKNLLKKTPSKFSLRKKNSLANLFEGVATNGSGKRTNEESSTKAADYKSRHSAEDRRSVSSKIPTSSRNSTSSYSQPPTSPSTLNSGGSRRRTGFLRNAIKGLSGGGPLRGPASASSSSHTRSASNSSASIAGSASKRASDISSREGSEKKGWVRKLGRAVSGRKVEAQVELYEAAIESPIESPTPMAHLAEKIRVPATGRAPIHVQPSRAPSRILISAVFPQATTRASERPFPSASAKESSDATTVYGHSIPEASLRSRDATASLRTSIPVVTSRSMSNRLIGDPFPAPTRHLIKRVDPPSALSFLPPVEIHATSSNYTSHQALNSPSDSSGNEDIYSPPSPSPKRRSFRAPSPARFRDFFASESASSSPEKNARGLPQPSDGSPRSVYGESPKKRAMGPEQIIEKVEDSADEGIVEARGATTDLAALFSDLEDTQDLNASVGSTARTSSQNYRDNYADLSASLRRHLPRFESVESLRSTVSDVPDDLQQLIRLVSDHISEVEVSVIDGMRDQEELDEMPFDFDDVEQAEPFGDEYSSEEASSDKDGHPSLALHRFENTDDFLDVYVTEGSGGSTTGPLSSASPTATSSEGKDSTAESFEEHISTAAMALREMLSGSAPGQPAFASTSEEDEMEAEEDEQPRFRDSVREYLEMERPTVGEKMLDRLDGAVSLTSLVQADSPAPSVDLLRHRDSYPHQPHHLCNQSIVSSSEGSSECGMGSPTPASGQALLRHSMVRYSQDRSRRQPRRRSLSIQSITDSSESEFEGPPADELTSISFAQSSRSTDLSISSLYSSPCPPPRSSRIPMLTRQPPPIPDFRFPPLSANSSANSTIRRPKDGSGPPWTQTHSSSSPTKSRPSSSPFKKLFNPLEEFKARGTGKRGSGSASEEDSTGEIQLQKALAAPSPRFVRPLQPTKEIPRRRPLSAQSLSNVFVPPDTPPPSSPSISASDSDRSSQFSAFRSSFDLDRQHPPVVAVRAKGHSRQVSKSSSIIRETIEEDKRETPASLASSPTAELPFPPPISPIVLDFQRPLEPIEEPPSPPRMIEIADVETEKDTVEQEAGPQTFNLSFAPAPKDEGDDEFDEQFDEVSALMDDDVMQTVMRSYVHFHYEAEMEIRRSQTLWPDTDASREALAHFKRPTTTHDILQYLFDSQNRFHSRAYHHHSTVSVVGYPSPDIYLSHAMSPPSPMVSFDGSNSKEPPDVPTEVSPPLPSPVPASKIRMLLGAQPVNRHLVQTKSTSSPKKEETLLPFTALPPKLGFKMRGLRSKLAASQVKAVDVRFLGGGKPVTKRSKDQFDAARRKLEGVGSVEEQKSDGESESENSGVLEAKGEGGSMEFARTPKLTTTRPRVRRRQGLSMLR